MKRMALLPPGSQAAAEQIKVSPGIISGDHVFLTGITGSRSDGSMPDNLEEQFRHAFDKIGFILAETGLKHDAIVEMTSYHVGLTDHFDMFNRVRSEYVGDPYPAWTAVEVAGLRRDGAAVEIRVVAAMKTE